MSTRLLALLMLAGCELYFDGGDEIRPDAMTSDAGVAVDAQAAPCVPVPGSTCAAAFDVAVLTCQENVICYPNHSSFPVCVDEVWRGLCASRDCSAPYEERERLNECLAQGVTCDVLAPIPPCML